MNWTAIGAIGEVLGATGVVLTLLFLIIQLRRFSQQLKIQNERGLAVDYHNQATLQSSPHMLDVLEKVYGRNETDLTFKEMLLMEAYMVSSTASIGADYNLFKAGIVDEKTWSARLQLLAAIVSAEWPYRHWKAMPWVDPDLLAAVESVRGSPEISQYFDAIDSSVGKDGV